MRQKKLAVIMAGGLGERFWPATNELSPKYTLPFTHGKTLLSETYRRARISFNRSAIYVITVAEHRPIIRRLLPSLAGSHILTEPLRKNTAGALTLATLLLKEVHGSDAVITFFPADHMIKQTAGFSKTVRRIQNFVSREGRLAIMGIRPTYPATGFGYIEKGRPISRSPHGSFFVKRFVEKPPLSRARSYIRSRSFYWNSGIFTWRINDFEEAMSSYAPEYFKKFTDLSGHGRLKPRGILKIFRSLPNLPIDRLLMEKMQGLVMFDADFDWDDIGAWDALRRIDSNAKGNTFIGKGICEASQNCVVIAKRGRPVVICGVKDLVVVDSEAALLVCHRNKSQMVPKLKKRIESR